METATALARRVMRFRPSLRNTGIHDSNLRQMNQKQLLLQKKISLMGSENLKFV
jgi:hypothetical protein